MGALVSNWLEELRERVDPQAEIFKLLPPASLQDIAALSEGLRQSEQIELPDSFLALYRHCDGEGLGSAGLFFGLRLLSIQELFAVYDDQKSADSYERPYASSRPEGAIRAAWFIHQGHLALADPPVAHFLDRYRPNVVKKAIASAACPSLYAKLTPHKRLRIDLNEGAFGSPPPDLAVVRYVVIENREHGLWESWVCENERGFSSELRPESGETLQHAFHKRVEYIEAMGFQREVAP